MQAISPTSPQQTPAISVPGQAARHTPQRSERPGWHSAGQFDAFHHLSTTLIRSRSPPQQPNVGVFPSPHQQAASADRASTNPQPSTSRRRNTARANPWRSSEEAHAGASTTPLAMSLHNPFSMSILLHSYSLVYWFL